MKSYKTKDIRNIALLGNAGAGKTTLAEVMLYEGGVINRRGDVNSKNTASDYTIIEQEYGNSLFSTLLYTEFNDRKINIIDTPGMRAFAGSVISSLNVVSTALLVINSSEGIEAGTEGAFRRSADTETPLIFVTNGLDQENINFDQMVEDAKSSFGKKVCLVQYPVNPGDGFNQVIDVLKMKMYQWGKDGGTPDILDIPDNELEKANELHNELVEVAAENDDALMELFFDKGELSEDEMRQGLRLGMANREAFPIFCTCASKDMGVRRLMEFICNIVPSPADVKVRKEKSGKEVKMQADQPTSLFFFKSSSEQHIGEVSYFKVMSGKVSEGDDLINTSKGSKERVSQLFNVAGKNRTKVTEMVAGDIGATVKLKDVKVNQTLSDKEANIEFEPIEFPNPKFHIAVKAKNEAEDEKMGEILNKKHDEDPTYIIEYSRELKQVLLHCQGEYHLNTLKWFFEHEYKLDLDFSSPKIPYRETITKHAHADYRHKKQSGGSGQFGEVHLIIKPFDDENESKPKFNVNGKELTLNVRNSEEHILPWGGKLVFNNCIVGGAIDARFLPAIMKGIMEKMDEGPLTGSYARDIVVYVYDGKMHPVDSNEISFKLAGRHAFSEAFKNAGPKILEPIYDLEVFMPADRMGDVMSDLQNRRAIIMGMGSAENGYEKISAKVPQKEMNKYTTSLSSLTGGRGYFEMEYASYEIVPGDVQEQLLKTYEQEQSEE